MGEGTIPAPPRLPRGVLRKPEVRQVMGSLVAQLAQQVRSKEQEASVSLQTAW